MANQKLTELTIQSIAKITDLMYVVIYDGDEEPLSVAMNLQELLASAVTGVNRIISGQVVWTGVGFVHRSVNLAYEINRVIYFSNDEPITNADPDLSDPRFDVIFVDADGLDIKEGTPAGSPTVPSLDNPTDELGTNIVLVTNGETTPTGVTLDALYSENLQESGGEWDTFESTSGARIDLSNAVDPINLVVDIKATSPNALDFFNLNHSVATQIEDFQNLRFKIKSLSNWKRDYIKIVFLDGVNIAGYTIINSGFFDTTDTSTIVDLFIPYGAVSWTLDFIEFDIIRFLWIDGGGGSAVSSARFQIDLIKMEIGGISTKPQPSLTMDSMANMTNAKTTPIDADNLTLWDSVVGQFKQLPWDDFKTALNSLFVRLTTNQSIDGVKIFTSFSITPSSAPTTNYQVANKKYVDDSGGSADIPADEITIITEDGVIKTAEFNSVNSSSFGNRARIPLVSFMDDDGREESYTDFLVTLDLKGIKAGFAIVVDLIDTSTYMTTAQVETLVDEGHELVNHLSTNTDMVTNSEDENREQLRNANEKLKYWGSEKRGFVYPGLSFDDDVIRVTREYVNFAYGLNGLPIIGASIPSFTLTRITMGNFRDGNPAEVGGIAEGNTLAYFKACVDYIDDNNGWITFANHSWDGMYDDTMVRDLIDYIQGLGIDIVTPSVGYTMHGNALTIGDGEGDSISITKDGIFKDNVDILSKFHKPFSFKTTQEVGSLTIDITLDNKAYWTLTGGANYQYPQFLITCPTYDISNVGEKEIIAYSESIFDDDVTSIGFANEELTELNITMFKNLTSLKPFSNPGLQFLDLTGMFNLVTLWAYSCDLQVLDLRDCYSLEQLQIHSNPDITHIDLSNCPNLLSLNITTTGINKLDCTPCTKLTEIVNVHDIIDLDVRGCSLVAAKQDDIIGRLEQYLIENGTLRMVNQASSITRTKNIVDSGTTDNTVADKLEESGQNFITTVSIGDAVRNITDNTWALVTGIDSDTVLSLDADIMVSGDEYEIDDSTPGKDLAVLYSRNWKFDII